MAVRGKIASLSQTTVGDVTAILEVLNTSTTAYAKSDGQLIVPGML